MKYIDDNLGIDDENNEKKNENAINIMLTPEEKINELTGIIKEKEKEISIMKKVSNKLYNKTLMTSTDNFTKENSEENNKTLPLKRRKNDIEIISQLNDLKSKYSMNESFTKDIADIINKLDNKEEVEENIQNNSSIPSNINIKNSNVTFKSIVSNNVGVSQPENSIKGIKITPYKKEKENEK